ncbi:MAG: aminoacyl-tRNA hydrolase [Lachnospiraceae bacterium]|nr:aminoacyl-tRNA hydrolase [Lachnospiraceae bacterium]
MYAIFGLGNPEKQYDKTRHNIGFDVIDELASQMGVSVTTKRHKALVGQGMIGSEKVILVKPQTYMNLSGESVRAVCDFYKLNPEEDIIVIYDDISLEVGSLRIRGKGSAGGHNGIKSIIAHTGTQTFKRIKVGVGSDQHGDMVKHVLGRFGANERKIVDETVVKAAAATEVIIIEDINTAMNKFN